MEWGVGCGERQNKKGKVVLMEKSDMPYIYIYGRWNNNLLGGVCVLFPRTCEYVSLSGKGTLQRWLRICRWKIILDYLGGLSIIAMDYKGKRRKGSQNQRRQVGGAEVRKEETALEDAAWLAVRMEGGTCNKEGSRLPPRAPTRTLLASWF